jgi:alcohol dehydrogenase YqhD (iron-dependent ADH family)
MENFTFRNPTKVIFGRGQIAQLARGLPAQARVLMTYGGGSVADGTKFIAAIAKMRAFFEAIGAPTRLSAAGIPAGVAAVVEQRLADRGVTAIGERGDITPAVVRQILAAAA